MQNLCLKLDQDVGYSRPAADFHQLAPSSPIRTKREAISSEPDTPIHRNTIHRPGSSLNDEGIAIPELKHGSEPSSDEAGIAARIDQSLKAGPTIANVENETDCETENVVDGTKSFGPEENFLRALVSFGAKEVIDSPRDAAAFHCLHTILVHLEKNFPLAAADRIHSQEDTVSLSIQCLLRCMALTDQSTSSGMMGWHEFGSNRMSDGIYSLSNQLASAFASRGQWKESGDVLRAMLLRCEQHLPLYHPITLAVLLDLAGVLAKLCKREQSQTLIIVATHRLGIYLEEVESSYFRDLNEAFNVDVADKSAFRIEKGCGSLSLLKAFVGEAERLSTRPMLSLFGPSHDVSITNGRLLADAFATLANCVSAGERLQGVPQSAETSAMYWRLAFIHYHRAFKVLTLSKGSENVSTVTVALSLARCLRQLGQPARALELLENVTQDDGCRSRRHPAANKCRARSNGGSRHTFTPHKRHEKRDYQERPIVTEIVSGLCFWSMAVLTLDNSPIAGLNRALRNLRLSKKWFKKALDVSHEENVSLRETCSAYLCTIDNEIKLLSDHGVSHNALPKLLHQYSFRGTRNEGR